MANYLMKSIFSACLIFNGYQLAKAADIESLIRDAEAGSKSALYELGVRYGDGDGVRENQELAARLYEKAARSNYGPAQNNLGWAFRQGLGVKKDPLQAVYWFRLAAIQGNALALQNLAEMYEAGEGVKRNLNVAEDLYTLCAVQPVSDQVMGREAGFNNAVLECRKQMGKIVSARANSEEEMLIRAARWYRLSLMEIDDLSEDNTVGARARRAARDTSDTLKKIYALLSPMAKQKLDESLKHWDVIRLMLLDRTAFPLTEVDCAPENLRL